MDWTAIGTVVASVALLLGCLLTLVAAVGLLRLSDLLARMHTTAKPQVLGVVLSLVAVGAALQRSSDIATLVAIAAFQLLTVPVAAHVVGRAAYRTGQVDPTVLDHDDLADTLAEEERSAG
ncbi:monovalent cation/H(+) antiporter subunit G [Kineococcus sp. LSe6-4]|uniref:Monovalent cation/H(+) antiporter subunit G n=1 Tax=Kineococcus halophytocola TaxID=3234027 RepID=A0ABV4GV43_9ACTN